MRLLTSTSKVERILIFCPIPRMSYTTCTVLVACIGMNFNAVTGGERRVRRSRGLIPRALQVRVDRPTPCSSSIQMIHRDFECAFSSGSVPSSFHSLRPLFTLQYPFLVNNSLRSIFDPHSLSDTLKYCCVHAQDFR